MTKAFALLFLGLLAFSCSQQSNRPAAVAFHNINAKFNAIWQADRLYQDLQKKAWEERKENYSTTLSILPAIDSTFGQAHSQEITNLIRKASLVINRHQNSHYIDDAYLLIGHGRFLQGDLKNAVETYKYINSIEPDQDTQIQALLRLYQIYIYQKDFENAEKVEEFIKEAPLSQGQKTEFLRSKAFYHQEKGEIVLAIALLEEVAPSLKSRYERARTYYLLGQLFQDQGKYSLAKENFEKSRQIKSNYDLQLNAQIAQQKLTGDENALEKMLKEPKNEDKKSEIYLALGQIQYEKNEFNQAKVYWEKASVNNPNKGELYLQLGNMFVRQLKKYPEAANYYDSAATYLASTHPSYAKAQKLKKSWLDYVQMTHVIRKEDSLQILGRKSLTELSAFYTQIKADQKRKIDSLNSQKKTAAPAAQSLIFTRRNPSPEQQSFYFYNEMARNQGTQEFMFKWGNRTLEDFWNRKNKNTNLSTAANSPEKIATGPSQSTETKATSSSDSLAIWLASIPRTDAQMMVSNKKIEQTLFALGKFAKLDLNENELAKKTLVSLLLNYPSTAYEAETLYLLYLSSYMSADKKEFKDRLADRYPESYFRQMILKMENGQLSQTKEIEVQKTYEKAYATFKQGAYADCFRECLGLQQRYPNSKLEDKIVFLMALCKGGLKDLSAYTLQLKNFTMAFPSSPLKPEAEALLKSITQNTR
jgi:tetratricopeptide (TPR) repeat protein